MYKIPDTLIEDILYNHRLDSQLKGGKISNALLKSNHVPMNLHEQWQDGRHMLHTRCTDGPIAPDRQKRADKVGAQVKCSYIDINTRQELPIHNAYIDDITPAPLSQKRRQPAVGQRRSAAIRFLDSRAQWIYTLETQ